MTTVRHADLLHRAHVRAHRRFVAMLRQRAYSDPNHPATRLYVEAERLVDALLGEIQWNTAKAALDALQAADERFCVHGERDTVPCEECGLGFVTSVGVA